MKEFVLVITFILIAQVTIVLTDNKNTKTNEIKKKQEIDLTTKTDSFANNNKLPLIQKRRDVGYYRDRAAIYKKHPLHTRHHGRIVNHQNQPFKQYGPPSYQNLGFNSEKPTNTLVNQDAPVKVTSLVTENPIATQNDQPFGQHSANYLPPRNQKLPDITPPYQFSAYEFTNNQQFQQQQQQQIFPEHNQQFNYDNQNSFESQNFGQNNLKAQQISDAVSFLTQNAQAISNLYGASAPNQNYAPNDDQFNIVHQQNQFDQNIRVNNGNLPSQLPSYASGILEDQETLEKIQSAEKDRIITQLQHALSNRENSARLSSDNNFAVVPSQFGGSQVASLFYDQPSTTASSLGYQSYYETPAISTTTTTTPSTTISTSTLQSTDFGKTSDSQVPQNFGSTNVNNVYPQYDGFVPTVITPTRSVPNSSNFPSSTAAVHPNINIKTTPTQFTLSTHPTLTVTTKPFHSNNPTQLTTPSFSIQLGSVHPSSVQTIVKPDPVPNPVPIVPSTIPVHPTYGLNPSAIPIHPTYGFYPSVVNSGFIYKPVKVYPLYYYPLHRKPVVTHPWNYAPSYFQTKIWK